MISALLSLAVLAQSTSGAPAPAPQSQLPAQLCSPSFAPEVERLRQGGVRYCGQITRSGVEQLRSMLAAEDSRLVITSIGGPGDASLALADLVLEADLDVEVAGPCFSGCASAVLIAARRRYIGPTGIVGFHNTATSALLLASSTYGGSVATMPGNLADRASKEMVLYARRSIDPDLLVLPQIEVATICIGRRGADDNGEPVFDLVSDLDVWTPDEATLAMFGIEVGGSYPRSQGDVEARLNSYQGAGGANTRIRFGRPSVSGGDLYRRLYAIGRC